MHEKERNMSKQKACLKKWKNISRGFQRPHVFGEEVEEYL